MASVCGGGEEKRDDPAKKRRRRRQKRERVVDSEDEHYCERQGEETQEEERSKAGVWRRERKRRRQKKVGLLLPPIATTRLFLRRLHLCWFFNFLWFLVLVSPLSLSSLLNSVKDRTTYVEQLDRGHHPQHRSLPSSYFLVMSHKSCS